MALHGNDQSHFSRGDGCTPDNPMLKEANSVFHNVNLSSHVPTYSINSYSHNAQLLLKNFSHCAGRPEFCLSSSYHGLPHDNHADDAHLGSGEQSLDFGHRLGISNPGHHNNSPDNSANDVYFERSQSSAGHVVRTRRRKAGGMEASRVCVVCGELASGYNFDRLTCESCKAFFRRNALKPKEKIKACGRNGDCNIEGSQRKHCPSCRLEKCLSVGMRKELILPPEKLEQRAKPKRRKQHLANDDGDGGSGGDGSGGGGSGTAAPPGLLSFSTTSGAVGSFPASATSSTSLHHFQHLHSPRISTPHFAADAHDFMSSRTLNTLITDMAGSRGGQGQFMSLSGLSDPQAAAAAAMKFHLAMTSNAGRTGVTDTFDHPTASHHRLLPPQVPPPADQFAPSEMPFLPEATSAAAAAAAAAAAVVPFLDARLSRPPTWQQQTQSLPSLPPPRLSSTPSEAAKSIEIPYSAAAPTTTGCSGLLRPRQCRYRNFQSLCYHRTCRQALLRQHRRLLNSSSSAVMAAAAGGLELERPDERLFTCLTECVQRIREPFSPEEPLDTRVAQTLEQEYNRMDICIRRVIRVVKMLPYFNEIGKPAQLGLLRANIYGMIVLYSSFFFERSIRKLRYPVKQMDGSLTSVTVSMLDDLAPSVVGDERAFAAFLSGKHRQAASIAATPASLREDFELYKANTLAAFNHLEDLTGEDDILRMTLLAIKLFSDDSLSDELQSVVVSSKRVYLIFLWNYIRWRTGPKHLHQATELFARLHLAFIDLRSLEIRMTEFAKLVSLEGLSPLMREICSLRSNSSGSGGGCRTSTGGCGGGSGSL